MADTHAPEYVYNDSYVIFDAGLTSITHYPQTTANRFSGGLLCATAFFAVQRRTDRLVEQRDGTNGGVSQGRTAQRALPKAPVPVGGLSFVQEVHHTRIVCSLQYRVNTKPWRDDPAFPRFCVRGSKKSPRRRCELDPHGLKLAPGGLKGA